MPGAGFKAWVVLAIIAVILYIVNASILIYFQYLYFQNPSYVEGLFYGLPYMEGLGQLLSLGYMGLLGIVGLILTLVMAYVVTMPMVNPRSTGTARITVVILVILLLFMGNVGLVLGLILMVASAVLMR
ncbi:hypothetical protein [Vulcanisaeta thermophila]|uniref:hypothetical protein n=1 Tax=Vulcanisaeta thermophila TaxID=867917 RepID=UPI000853B6C1|nr:hypothetical protein [Vulcanisaeta thermophila]